MTLWPRTLVGRNALLIVGLIVLAELGSAILVRQLVTRPRVDEAAESVARNLQALRDGLVALPPDRRDDFVAAFQRRIAATAGVRDAADANAASDRPDGPVRLAPLEARFVRIVSDRLAVDGMRVVWRREQGGGFALWLAIDGRGWWLDLPRTLPYREATGVWLAASIVAAALAIVGALAIQRRIAQPLRALVDGTRTLAAGGRPEPLDETGPTEIAAVSRSFNQLTASLAAIERERALMLAGVSHDLRTPLTKLRLGVEIVTDGVDSELRTSLERSVAEIDAIVGQFLDYARADEEGDSMPTTPTSLDALAREVAASVGATVVATGVPALQARAPLVRRALANLVGNAAAHGRPPIVVRTGFDAATAWVEVEDAGPGIDPAEIESLKRPFRRGSTARTGVEHAPGTGLGLAIAERVARRHGGSLELSAAAPTGLVARLRLPRA